MDEALLAAVYTPHRPSLARADVAGGVVPAHDPLMLFDEKTLYERSFANDVDSPPAVHFFSSPSSAARAFANTTASPKQQQQPALLARHPFNRLSVKVDPSVLSPPHFSEAHAALRDEIFPALRVVSVTRYLRDAFRLCQFDPRSGAPPPTQTLLLAERTAEAVRVTSPTVFEVQIPLPLGQISGLPDDPSHLSLGLLFSALFAGKETPGPTTPILVVTRDGVDALRASSCWSVRRDYRVASPLVVANPRGLVDIPAADVDKLRAACHFVCDAHYQEQHHQEQQQQQRQAPLSALSSALGWLLSWVFADPRQTQGCVPARVHDYAVFEGHCLVVFDSQTILSRNRVLFAEPVYLPSANFAAFVNVDVHLGVLGSILDGLAPGLASLRLWNCNFYTDAVRARHTRASAADVARTLLRGRLAALDLAVAVNYEFVVPDHAPTGLDLLVELVRQGLAGAASHAAGPRLHHLRVGLSLSPILMRRKCYADHYAVLRAAAALEALAAERGQAEDGVEALAVPALRGTVLTLAGVLRLDPGNDELRASLERLRAVLLPFGFRAVRFAGLVPELQYHEETPLVASLAFVSDDDDGPDRFPAQGTLCACDACRVFAANGRASALAHLRESLSFL